MRFVRLVENSKMENNSSYSFVLTTEQWLDYVIFFILFGIIGAIGNSLIFLMIIKDKKLHTFFYTLIAGHTFSRAIYSLEYVINGVHPIVANFYPNVMFTSRLQCHTMHVLTYFCNSFSSLTILLLAIDRMYSLAKPAKYRKHSVKQGIIVNAISVLVIIVTKVVPSYLGSVPFSTQLICNTMVDVTVEWFRYNYYTNFFTVLASVIMYSVLFFVAVIRKKSLSRAIVGNEGITRKALKRQLLLLDSIRLLIIVNVLTVLPFNALQIVSNYFQFTVSLKISTIGACFSSVDRVIDPAILIWKSSDIRASFLRFFGCKSNSIALSPMTALHMIVSKETPVSHRVK